MRSPDGKDYWGRGVYREIVEPERLAFISHLSVSRNGQHLTNLTPARNYYPSADPTAGPIGRYFMGDSTSEVGLRSKPGGDLWTAFQPDLSPLNPDIPAGSGQGLNSSYPWVGTFLHGNELWCTVDGMSVACRRASDR